MHLIKKALMKTIFYLLLTASLLLSFASSTSAQETRKLDYFDAVAATGDVSVTLVRGDTHKVTITTKGMSEDDISIFVKGKTLKVQLIEGLFREADIAELTVTYTRLRSIKSSAGARVYVPEVLEADQVKLRASSGGYLELQVQASSIDATASEGGELIISGTTEDQKVTAHTGGKYQGAELECLRTYVKANTGGQAEVVARKRLEAKANTGGQVDYAGDPEYKNIRSLISGGVQKM